MTCPLVFLPGMMCDSRLFEPQITNFSRNHFVCVAPVSGFDSMESIAAEILKVAPEQFILAGLSLGGIVAMEMVRQAPKRILKIALMDTNHKAELPEISAKRAPQIEGVNQGHLSQIMRDQIKPNYLQTGSKRTSISNLCMAMANDLGEQVFIEQSRALASRKDQTETLKKIKVPTLVLCGMHDRICPIKTHEEIASLVENATLEIIPDAGHLPTLENPEITNRVLQKWLL